MASHIVGTLDEFPENTHRVVKIRNIEIGVFNVNGTFYALPNVFLHQFGPLCEGAVNGTMHCNAETGWKHEWVQDGEVLTCPWHGWEYDVTTGRALAKPNIRIRMYSITVDDDRVVVTL